MDSDPHLRCEQCRSVNVAGCKLWRLLPPQYTHLLYDRFGREHAPDFYADASRPEHYPNLPTARQHVIEVTQVSSRQQACHCHLCTSSLGTHTNALSGFGKDLQQDTAPVTH